MLILILVFLFALGHSDPKKLKESAQDHERLSSTELQKRQMEIKVIQLFLFEFCVSLFNLCVCVWCALCIFFPYVMCYLKLGNNGEIKDAIRC